MTCIRSIDKIFRDRACNKFLSDPVDKNLLVKIHDLAKLGPTSGNSGHLGSFLFKVR